MAAPQHGYLHRRPPLAPAVPPAVQAELAPLAAKRGKDLLLEKPLGPDLAAARRVADAVAESGVVSQLVLTKRYHPATRAFLEAARSFEAVGARSCYLHGAFLGGEFATGWRLEHGALLDLGPICSTCWTPRSARSPPSAPRAIRAAGWN